MDNLVYEDDPWVSLRLPHEERRLADPYKRWAWRRFAERRSALMAKTFAVVITVVSVGTLLAGTQIKHEAVPISIFGLMIFLTAVVFVALSSPTKYQVFNERIRIVLGLGFRFDIPFSNIGHVTAATFKDLWGLNLNFINSYSSDDILQITRKRGAKIHMTPDNRTLFLEHLNKALADWRRSNPS